MRQLHPRGDSVRGGRAVIPGSGDESFAIQQRFELGGFDYSNVSVYVRLGAAITRVSYAELAPPDIDEVQRYVRFAVRKLEAAEAGG